MKKLLLSAALFSLSLFAYAQETGTITIQPEDTGAGWGKYIGASVSVTNSNDLGASSYFSVEGGVTKQNLSLGVAVGRSTFGDNNSVTLSNGNASEEKDLWFAEPKAQFVLLEYGIVRGYVMTGFGAYALRDDVGFFIEYGGGALMSLGGGTDIAVQFSNWDSINYVSLGIAKSF